MTEDPASESSPESTTSTPASPPEPTNSPITFWQFLRGNWKYGTETLSDFIKNSNFIKNSGRGKSDKFWEENAYGIIRAFGTLGLVALLGLVLLSPFLGPILEKFSIPETEIVRDFYYILIFIGAGIAASIATWRGRQTEHQINKFEQQLEDSRLERQVARLEKAIDMATDHTSVDRRASGFLILHQMFSNWRENFDHLIVENLGILERISTTPFWITEKKNGEILRKLRENNRSSYSEEIEVDDLNILFEITSEHKINSTALSLWQEIANWRGERLGDFIAPHGTYAIYSYVVKTHKYFNYVFFQMNLDSVIFLMRDDRGKINISNPFQRANFIGSYFVQVSMKNATLDRVDFLNSHFFAINYLEKRDQMACGMSCKGTIFDRANLINCYFGETDFEKASFIGANISGSDFSQAKGLTQEQFLQGAYWIKPGKPKFPEGGPDGFPPGFAAKLPNDPPTLEVIKEWERRARFHSP